MTSHSTDDSRWLHETLMRTSLRSSRVLRELSAIPTLLAVANLGEVPEAEDVQAAAEAIETAAAVAMDELTHISSYMSAVLDSGPVSCATCGADLYAREAGWSHWRKKADPESFPQFELYEADHETRPVWGVPERPNWQGQDADITTTDITSVLKDRSSL